jgi:hypothetical protein
VVYQVKENYHNYVIAFFDISIYSRRAALRMLWIAAINMSLSDSEQEQAVI